jgi:hypothetical protein
MTHYAKVDPCGGVVPKADSNGGGAVAPEVIRVSELEGLPESRLVEGSGR